MTPKYHINLFWSEADGAWVADVPDLQSCSAFGDTPAEALSEVKKRWKRGSRSLVRTVCRSRSLDTAAKSAPQGEKPNSNLSRSTIARPQISPK